MASSSARLAGKVVFITGAAQGIGKATALVRRAKITLICHPYDVPAAQAVLPEGLGHAHKRQFDCSDAINYGITEIPVSS